MSSKRNITYKCPYCEKRFNKENLVIHVGDKHDDMIPQGYTAFRLVFDYINKKPAGYNGKCIICGNETGWDENKGKYNRLCNNPECKKKYVKQFEDRMMKSKGVTRISSTAEGQAKMLANRKISGEYKFQDGGVKTYTGTYEKKALEFMDKVMNIKSEDVTTPGPILEYEFEDKKHMYISDIYYIPYNLIIEVKDGGNNPNNRSMPEYRAKQIAKEKWIIKNTDFNYLRLTNNDFSQLLAAFMELKMEMSNDTPNRVIRINEGNNIYIEESGTIISIYNKKKEIKKLNQELADKINSTDYPWYFLHIEALNNSGIGVVYSISSKVTLYGLDEDPGTDGSKKSSGLFSVANLGNGKLHKLYENEYKNYHINKSKDIDPALRKFTTYNRGAAKTKDVVLKEENEYIEEKYIGSQPDILYNKEAFDSGEINLCFVTGFSGSGKSTLAHGKESDEVEAYELDDILWNHRFSDDNLKEYGDLVYSYFKGPGKKYRVRTKEEFKKLFRSTEENSEASNVNGCTKEFIDHVKEFVKYSISYSKSHKNKKYIIEGVYLYMFFEPSYFKDYAFYIKGTSLLKSTKRALKRDWENNKSNGDSLSKRISKANNKISYTMKNIKYDNPLIDKFINYFKDKPETVLSESYVEEGFLKSEPDILYNKEAFDNGDTNICFITGHSGSGKSTLAHGQESDTVEVYELDDLQCIADRFTMANLKEYGDLIYTYFKGPGKQFYTTWEKLKEDMTPGKDYEDKLYPGFVAYAIDWAKKHKDKKYILEGVWLFCNDETGKPYFEPSYFKDYAFYIKGTSAIKSKWRAAKRDMKYDMKEESHNRLFWIKSFTKSFFLKNWKWYKFDEKEIQVFRDYFKDKPETVLSEAYIEESTLIQSNTKIFQYSIEKKHPDKVLDNKTLKKLITLLNKRLNNGLKTLYYNLKKGQDNDLKIELFDLEKPSLNTFINSSFIKYINIDYSHPDDEDAVYYDKEVYTIHINIINPYLVYDELMNSGVYCVDRFQIDNNGNIKFIRDEINSFHESYIEETTNTLSTSQIKAILKKISDKVKSDSKPPTGNQNCMLCTWCLEAQLRGYNILPRPVYSPRDIIFKQVPYNIVKNPEKLKIRNKNDVTKQVLGTGNGSRYYVHVNWKGGSGGHEFIIMNINNKVYVLDAQQNELSDINISVNGLSYFNDINYANSYIIRLDDKELNKDILKYNDNKYIIEWDDVKDPEYMKSDEYLNEASISNYKFLDIKSNKSKALEYLKANSETKSYAEDTIKNYNGELVIYNDTMIGRILIGDKKDKGFITDFSIDEEHRGNKLGSKLIDDAINKYHGYDLLVDKDNELAINMYKRRGFIIVKTYKNQYYMKLESKLKEDINMMNEAMNALMTGYIPGSVDNPNNTYIVNYMQNNVFSDEDPNEDCIGVSSDPLFTNMIIRDKNGMLKRVDESFLKDKDYKVYIIEKSIDEVNDLISANIGNFVKYGYLYETLTGKKLYSKDQVGLEGVLIPVMDYYKSMDIFKEICDNYFFARDKKEESINESTFIPKEVRYFNNSGLMYIDKVYTLNGYINSKSNKVLEALDITIK